MRRAVVAALLLVAACARTGPSGSPPASPSESPTPAASVSASSGTGSATPCPAATPCTPPTTATPAATPAATGNAAERPWTLRFDLLAHYRNFAYCDPDQHPVARSQSAEQSNADDWWARNGDTPEGRAILDHHGWSRPLSSSQRLEGYRDHKKLTVIDMHGAAGGYDYTLSISQHTGAEPDTTVRGFVSDSGSIRERSREPRNGGCPICLEAWTKIATPRGPVDVRALRAGDVVYTLSAGGRRVAARIERVSRRATPGPHLMVRLVLRDGRTLVAAGAHPVAGGGLLRDLRAGDRYDGSVIDSTGYVRSSAAATYDILPAGPSGLYWANGILVGSTLA